MRSFVSWIAGASAAALVVLGARGAAAAIEPHLMVSDGDIADAEIRGPASGAWKGAAWDDLEKMRFAQGRYEIRVRAMSGYGIDAVEVPVCNVRGKVRVDGQVVAQHAGAVGGDRAPVVVRFDDPEPTPHDVVLEVVVSGYEHRIACGGAPRAGVWRTTRDGLGTMTFDSPHAREGGGRAVVYLPPGHDAAAPSAVLVGTHPWNSDTWSYAAYAELLREARAKDLVLVMPNGLGNSLYIAKAEDEVMRTLDALAKDVAVDPKRVSIWGASMGGAGATTIGFHHPDRFATITSFFGDSKYDITTYVRSILPDDPTAHQVNALDVVENARHVPVWLIHGEDDHTSPIVQSEMLDQAMRARHFHVRFDRVPGKGHEGEVVARFLPEIVALASTARVPDSVSRVTYWSVRPGDTGAYGVTIARREPRGDAYVDVEKRDDGVHVKKAVGVRSIALSKAWLGVAGAESPAIVVDDGSRVIARWE